MSATKHSSRNSKALARRSFTLLKRKAERTGISYSSARDARFRGELPVLKIGKNERYQRWYVDDADWDRWINSRMEARKPLEAAGTPVEAA